GNFLVAKEQHLMLNERGANLGERVIAELSEMYPANLCTQSSGDRIHRYMLPTIHRRFLHGQHTRHRTRLEAAGGAQSDVISKTQSTRCTLLNRDVRARYGCATKRLVEIEHSRRSRRRYQQWAAANLLCLI